MGNKKAAVREIMRVLPEWVFREHERHRTIRGVRLDSDGEVIATTASTNAEAASDAVNNHDFMSLGFIRTGMGHSEQHAYAEWFVPAQPVERAGAGLIGHVFDRMEYEIFRAAILEEEKEIENEQKAK